MVSCRFLLSLSFKQIVRIVFKIDDVLIGSQDHYTTIKYLSLVGIKFYLLCANDFNRSRLWLKLVFALG